MLAINCINSQSQFKKTKTSFKGHYNCEVTGNLFHSHKLTQETAFFRQMPALDYVRNFVHSIVQKNGSAKILDGACSTGEETWSLAMLLHDLAGKVRITGFDLGPKAIEKARQGTYEVAKNPFKMHVCDAFRDDYLIKAPSGLSAEQLEHQRLFSEFFEQISPEEENTIRKRLFQEDKPILDSKFFRLKPEKIVQCDFVQGDITKLDDIAQDSKTDVLLFRNALYHLVAGKSGLLGFRKPMPRVQSQPMLENIVNSIRKKLTPDGIFVLGNNECLQGTDTNLLAEVMEKYGFVPRLNDNEEICVWQKV